MAARLCESCGIKYPSIQQFDTCPIHGEETTVVQGSPDLDWQAKFATAKVVAEEARKAIPVVHNVAAYEADGQLWVNQGDLWRAGARLSRFQNEQFYLFELDDGFIYETQGFDDPRRRWWVEQVATALVLPDESEVEAVEASRAD